jgi:hypothetical protein
MDAADSSKELIHGPTPFYNRPFVWSSQTCKQGFRLAAWNRRLERAIRPATPVPTSNIPLKMELNLRPDDAPP